MTRLVATAEPITIGGGSVEVVVLPGMGARLHRLRAFGHDLLRTPDDVEEHLRDPFFWGAYVMAPWCNRLDAGPVSVDGRIVDLQPNFRDGSAIHGQVYARPWEHDRQAGTLPTFSVRGGGDGWPWGYVATLRIEPLGDGLRIEQELVNASTGRMPAGLGLHPWFRRPVEVAIRGDLVFTSNVASSPSPQPVSGNHDLRQLGQMAAGLDATWARLTDPAVELRWPDIGVEASLRTEARTTYIVAASPPELDAIAVEPQTHAPQGLRRLLNGEAGALELLEAGEAISLTTEMTFRHATAEDQP